MKIVLELPEDWSERQACILAARLENHELPTEIVVAVQGDDGQPLKSWEEGLVER